MNLLLYFWLFLKASLFSTGGLGNLPFLHQDLIELGWAGEPDFLTAIAVGQISPGPNGLWSISLGYLTFGWLGAGIALAALTLPPLLVLVIGAFYDRVEKAPAVQDFMRGLSLSVIGLTLAVSFGLINSAVTDRWGFLIGAAALGLAMSKKAPVIVVLGLSALAGVLIYGA
jgi:chromate transporter